MNTTPEINTDQNNWSNLNTCGVIKRLIFASIGLGVILHDHLESQIDKLEKRGREASKNGKIWSVEGICGPKRYYRKENIKNKHKFEEFLSNFNIPNSHDFARLEMRITDLENDIDQLIKKNVT